MPSTDETPPGDGYRFLLALYLTIALVGTGTTVLASRGVGVQSGAVAVLLGGLGTLAVVGAAVGLGGVPRPLYPQPLYEDGRSWLPATLGVAVAVVAGSFGVRSGATGPLLLAAATGLGLGVVGWLIQLAARTAVARARVDFGTVRAEWRGRPSPGRRRAYYVGAGVATLVIGATVVWFREPSLVALLGAAISLAGQGATEWHVRVTDDALVFGNPGFARSVERERIAGVTREGETLRIGRRGLHPSLSFDTSDIEDVEAAVAALTQLGTHGRQR